MLTPNLDNPFFDITRVTRRQLGLILAGAAVVLTPFLLLPELRESLLASDFVPHVYCYLANQRLVWTNVTADLLIGVAYFSISLTLGYLVYKARRNIPFHWMFLAFGLFIIACGGTHFMEVVTTWIPVYVISATVKLFTAVASVTTAIVLPFTIPRALALVQQAKASEEVNAKLRASEERKAALLREVNHRVKNNLAVICSLFYLQSTHTEDRATVQMFRDMENRVHSMALVHQSLYGSENLARIDFAEYARTLAEDILASHKTPTFPIQLHTEMHPVILSVDLALPCGLILNELISNAFKHGFPDGAGGEIKLTVRSEPEGKCTLCVEDTGVGLPFDLDVNGSKTLGLKLVRSLAKQIRGSFELINSGSGTCAYLQFTVDPHASST